MTGCNDERLDEDRVGVVFPAWLRPRYIAPDCFFRQDGQWWVVWPLDRLVESTLVEWEEGSLDRSLVAFGDDGAGDPFCFDANRDGPVVRWSMIDTTAIDEVSSADFATDWLGLS